jgi:hypothetical protein
VAAALVNASNQIGGSLGAALLNTIAASATATYLAQHALPAAAAVHGDVVAFTSLIAVFAAGAVITAALYPRRDRVAVPAARGPAVPPAAAPGLNANPPAGSHDGTAAANGTHS